MTQELTATSIVSLFETSKPQRASFVTQIVSAVNDGIADPLKVQLQLKCMEDIIKQVNANKAYKDALLEKAQQNGRSFDFHNSKFEVKEVGVKYDYSKCEDPILAHLQNEMERVEAKLKERQKFLQNAPIEGTQVVTEDGEVVTIYPPAKSSTTSVAVTLK